MKTKLQQVHEAKVAYDKAWTTYQQASRAFADAGKALVKVLDAYDKVQEKERKENEDSDRR